MILLKRCEFNSVILRSSLMNTGAWRASSASKTCSKRWSALSTTSMASQRPSILSLVLRNPVSCSSKFFLAARDRSDAMLF